MAITVTNPFSGVANTTTVLQNIGQYATTSDLPSAANLTDDVIAWVIAEDAWYGVTSNAWGVVGGIGGDMSKSTYDADDNGRVDDAEQLNDGSNTVTAAQARTHIDSTSNPHTVTAAQIGATAIRTQLLTVDGSGSGIDADLLDGSQGSAYAKLSGGTFTGAVTFNNATQVRFTPNTSLGTTGTLTLNMTATTVYDISTLTGNVTFATSNRAAGRNITARIRSGGSSRTLTFPAGWVFVGTKPASIAASKTAILTITAFGTAESDIVAAYSVQS